MEVYIVISRFKKRTDFTTIGVSSECYSTMEKAIEFCRSRLDNEELEEHDAQLKRKLINWYEFDSKDYKYEIKILNVK